MVEKKLNIFWPAISGLITAILISFGIYYLPLSFEHDFLSLFLAGIASIYLGAALGLNKKVIILIELFICIFIFFLAIFGLYISPYILVAGYLFHSIWSFFHFPHRFSINTVKILPPFFFIFDIIISLYIILF